MDRADSLFLEFHKRLILDCARTFDQESGQFIERPDSIGLLGREAIYYAADSFYRHQFEIFGRQRYKSDARWLRANVGLAVDPMLDIARFIADRINEQMTAAWHFRKEGREFTKSDLTRSLMISKWVVRERFGAESDAFFAKNVTADSATNTRFTSAFSVNEVALAPIIEMGDYIYVPNQYRLFESIYESPFYWMMNDKAYADSHAENRGSFLEKSAGDILSRVFGTNKVHRNVVIERSARERAGEIDVLVIYEEFVLVVQAKSKRMSMSARSGNTDSLEVDFALAVQNPYRQALECIQRLNDGAKCVTQDGKELVLHTPSRFFPIVVLSDAFPASTLLSRYMLERGDNIPPVIWDLGVLDCVARLLNSPVEMLLYLKRRSDAFDNVISDSEFNYLGYHIQNKLIPPPNGQVLVLEREHATVVDNKMILADLDIGVDSSTGIT